MAQEEPKLKEVEELKKDLEEAKAKCEEYLNGWKRERADFINFKKSETDRMSELVKFSNEDLILKILPILDNLYLAEKHLADAGLLQENEWLQGFTQIKKQLEDFLAKEGISPIDSIGKQFDPNIMEAVGDVPADAEGSGVAKEEVQRGYTLHGRIIRVAKVKVSK